MELGDDAPPEEIWLDDEALEGHFEGIKIRREMEGGGGGEAVEQVPMSDNDDDEIARWRR